MAKIQLNKEWNTSKINAHFLWTRICLNYNFHFKTTALSYFLQIPWRPFIAIHHVQKRANMFIGFKNYWEILFTMNLLENVLLQKLGLKQSIQDIEKREVFLMNLKKSSIKKLKLNPFPKMTDFLKKAITVLAVRSHLLLHQILNVRC